MYIKVLFFGYIREVTMKRNVFFVMIIAFLLCFSCSMGHDLSKNVYVEQGDLVGVVKNGKIVETNGVDFSDKTIYLLNNSTDVNDYSIYRTTSSDDSRLEPRSGIFEEGCPPHAESIMTLETDLYVVVDESVKPRKYLGLLKVVTAVYSCSRCGGVLESFTDSVEFIPAE